MSDLIDYGYVDIDEQKRIDNEKCLAGKSTFTFTKEESTSPSDVHKVPKGKNVKGLIKRKKPKNWIIDQIRARGNLVLLEGESGSGKTYLFYSMADAIAKGDLFLNTFQTKQQKVVFIQADEIEINCTDKLETMGIESNITFYFSDTFKKLTVDELPKFQELVDNHDYDVIFLDSLTTLLTGVKDSFKDAVFAALLYFLNDIASKKDILIVLTTHLKKQNMVKERDYLKLKLFWESKKCLHA